MKFFGVWFSIALASLLIPKFARATMDLSLSAQYKKLNLQSSPNWSSASAPLTIRPTLKTKISNLTSFKASPNLSLDLLTKENTERFQVAWNDTYFEMKFSKAKLRLGFQNIVWEGTDFSNPLDFVMQKNLTDPLDSSPISSPGLGYLLEIGPMQLDFYFIPEMTASHLPGPKNPWWPRSKSLRLETKDFSLLIPQGLEYEISPAVEINHARSNNWGGRFQFKSDAIDSSFAYFNGLSNSPYVTLDLLDTTLTAIPNVLLVNSPVKLRPVHFRVQAVGALFVIPIKGNLFKFGGNAIQPYRDDPSVPGSATSQLLGWERSFDLRRGPLTTLIQFHQIQTPQNGQLANFQSIFTKAAAAGLRMTITEDTTALFGFVYDLIGFSSLSKAELSVRLAEKYEINFAASEISGNSNTLLGIYDSYDSLNIKFTGYF
jgi:hypothetical protein